VLRTVSAIDAQHFMLCHGARTPPPRASGYRVHRARRPAADTSPRCRRQEIVFRARGAIRAIISKKAPRK